MNFRRILANAVARRVAFVLVAAVFAWLGIGSARAQQCGLPTPIQAAAAAGSASTYSDEGTAYAACNSTVNAYYTQGGGIINVLAVYTCEKNASSNSFIARFRSTGDRLNSSAGCAALTTVAPGTYTANAGGWNYTALCAARPDQYGWTNTMGGDVCHQGCRYSHQLEVGAPGGFSFYATGARCTEAEVPPPQPDADGDGVPDIDDAFPNDPNESVDSDGDGIGDNADVAPDDETNGEDEGEGNETDNSASGGGDCNAPPSCKGDGIACNTNFQVWKLRCQGTAHGSVTGNVQDCNQTVTVVSPDPIANAQLLALRKIACKDGDGGTGSGDGFGSGDSDNLGTIADAVRGEGEPDNSIGPEEPGDAWYGEGEEQPDSFDESGYGFGSSCPEVPSIDVFGTSIDFNVEPLCDWATLGGYIVIALAGLGCVRIISGRAA